MDTVAKVKKSKSLGLFPNVLIIVMQDGSKHKFVLGKRNKIAESIQSFLIKQ
ncbi:hypothetical protein [Virgibacillus sp. L01]|uniref:hypothetical protein n=1 Tax=Virgibacillus sp. L01 TaxID=3457429 RepID=UPI003FD597C9